MHDGNPDGLAGGKGDDRRLNRRDFLKAARGYFPHSNDWTFMRTYREDQDRAWTKEELKEQPSD